MTTLNGIGMTSDRTRARMIERLREEGIRDERVLMAMAQIPRHLFVSEALSHRAYEDTALPLILGQTISQPYVVARMIELLLAGRNGLGKTLEIGVGCGYQAAVLSRLTKELYGIERLGQLLSLARDNLHKARITGARLKHGDGMGGLPEAAPFDSIIVAAGAFQVPQALLDQLAPGGRLIIPSGSSEQALCVHDHTETGITQARYDSVRFVPLLPGVG